MGLILLPIPTSFYTRWKAIQIRQKQKIKLPDALIAATAIELHVPLVTGDKRLEKIEGLNCLIFEF